MSAPIEVRLRPRQHETEHRLESAGLHPLLARLFASRGVETIPRREAAALLPPDSLLDIDCAARRIADAIEHGEQIVIVADYDCDGATACAVGVRGLRSLGARVGFVVPNRFSMGYGLSEAAVDLARAQGASLLITVDNGIASVAGVDHARAHGLDVVITDHHLPGPRLPAATAIVNPNQPGCRFASKALAGVGVMFYVLTAIRAELRHRGRFDAGRQPRLDALLDLVALGTVADLVSLDANNRLLVQLGLERIRAGRAAPGLLALARVAGRETRSLSASDLGFAVAPRVNAAGRLADMRLGIECLTTDESARAFHLAEQLDRMNTERKQLQQDMNEKAAEIVLDTFDPHNQRTIVAFDTGFHPGVTGLVASKLRERHHRPAIVFAPVAEDRLTGSGRSIPGFHLRDAIDLVTKRAPDLIERFGGHALAAGLTIRADQLDAFVQAFESVASEWLGDDPLHRVVEVDGPVEVGYLQTAVAQMIDAEVWGQGFAPPLFVDRWQVVSQRVVKERHIRALLQKDGQRFEAMAFNRAEPLPAHADLVFRLDLNDYNGTLSTRLLVEHVL